MSPLGGLIATEGDRRAPPEPMLHWLAWPIPPVAQVVQSAKYNI